MDIISITLMGILLAISIIFTKIGIKTIRKDNDVSILYYGMSAICVVFLGVINMMTLKMPYVTTGSILISISLLILIFVQSIKRR